MVTGEAVCVPVCDQVFKQEKVKGWLAGVKRIMWMVDTNGRRSKLKRRRAFYSFVNILSL